LTLERRGALRRPREPSAASGTRRRDGRGRGAARRAGRKRCEERGRSERLGPPRMRVVEYGRIGCDDGRHGLLLPRGAGARQSAGAAHPGPLRRLAAAARSAHGAALTAPDSTEEHRSREHEEKTDRGQGPEAQHARTLAHRIETAMREGLVAMRDKRPPMRQIAIVPFSLAKSRRAWPIFVAHRPGSRTKNHRSVIHRYADRRSAPRRRLRVRWTRRRR
jgi:hypothetical protein